MKNIPVLATILLMLVLAAGCTGKQQLSGTITFSDDKTPIPMGTVYFQSETGVSRAKVFPDGTYTVSSTGDRDGLPPGKYEVYLLGVDEPPFKDKMGREIPSGISLIEPKYRSASTAGISFTADGSATKFDFTVDRVVKKKR